MRVAALILLASIVAVLVGGGAANAQQRPLDQQALFRVVAGLYNLDPELLEAIAAVESRGNPEAVSSAGAQGLMQLMPATARRFRVADPFDPVDNALGAARFLDHLRRWQRGRSGPALSLPEFLAAYNAGEGAVDKYNGVPPYPETQEYVRRVLLKYLSGPLSPARAPDREAPKPATVRRLSAAEADRRLLDQLDQLRRSRALAAEAASAQTAPR